MAQVKNIHIIELTKNLIERLQIIKQTPHFILNSGAEEDLIKKLYPQAQFVKDARANLILGAVEFSEDVNLESLLKTWRKYIKPNGLLLFGLMAFEVDIQALGDFLAQLGFVKVVVDCEENIIYGHAIGPQEIGIKINQIRRVS